MDGSNSFFYPNQTTVTPAMVAAFSVNVTKQSKTLFLWGFGIHMLFNVSLVAFLLTQLRDTYGNESFKKCYVSMFCTNVCAILVFFITVQWFAFNYEWSYCDGKTSMPEPATEPGLIRGTYTLALWYTIIGYFLFVCPLCVFAQYMSRYCSNRGEYI